MRKITQYLAEVRSELQKASWPWDPAEKGLKKYRELTDSTLVVLVATVLLGAYVAGWDFIMQGVVRLITLIGA